MRDLPAAAMELTIAEKGNKDETAQSNYDPYSAEKPGNELRNQNSRIAQRLIVKNFVSNDIRMCDLLARPKTCIHKSMADFEKSAFPLECH